MGNWAKVDFKQLKQLQKNLDKMIADQDKINMDILKELAKRALRKAKNNTPVKSGELRRKWSIGSVSTKGGYYEIELYNPVEYAPYVEYGHRQVITDKDGKKITVGWTQGKFMLKVTCDEIQALAPAIIEKRLKKELEALFNGK